MAKSPTSEAERFRVERAGPFVIGENNYGFLVRCDRELAAEFNPEDWGWLHRDGFFIDFNEDATTENLRLWGKVSQEQIHYSTREEAEFRLLLYTDPRQALQPFLEHDSRGGIISYEGTCTDCRGRGRKVFEKPRVDFELVELDCPTCHGTGGQPAEHLLAGAADWYWERGMTMQAEVLRGLIAKGNDDGN